MISRHSQFSSVTRQSRRLRVVALASGPGQFPICALIIQWGATFFATELDCRIAPLLTRIARAAYRVQLRDAVLQGGQDWKPGMRLGLIPIRYGKIIIGAYVRVSVLDRRAQ